MIRVIWANASLRDLRAIDRWLNERATADIAARIVRDIRRRARDLHEHPLIGQLIRADGTRKLRATGTPYVLLYAVRGGVVQIKRVRHERENWRA